MTRLVLASSSPRRRALLAAVGRPADEVRGADVDETPLPEEGPVALVERLAAAKRDAVAARAADDEVVLAADTVVAHHGRLLNKPVDDEDATRMLRALAGDEATIASGVAVRHADGTTSSAVVLTSVRFHELSAATIAEYVATGEPRGVAGAFRLQGAGGALVASRTGCPTNVVGLPVCETRRLLAPAGVALPHADCTRLVGLVAAA